MRNQIVLKKIDLNTLFKYVINIVMFLSRNIILYVLIFICFTCKNSEYKVLSTLGEYQYDVVVYGATSSGVIASIATSRNGAKVLFIVPITLSASHVAYGSLRMEPVFMHLGHTSGTIAVLCEKYNVSTHDLNYNELRKQLLKEKQIL